MSELTLAYAGLVAMVFLFLSLCWIFASSYLLTERIEKHLGRSRFVANNLGGLSGLTAKRGQIYFFEICLLFFRNVLH